MAASFQLVMSPAKMPAMVVASRFSVSMPSRLNATATGEMYSGTSTMASEAQLAKPSANSSVLKARSEPMKLLAPAMKFSRPVPEPVGS